MGEDVISSHSLDQDDSLYWHPPDLQWDWGMEQVLEGKAPGYREDRWLGETQRAVPGTCLPEPCSATS